MPAKYVRPYCKGEKNDYRDAEAIAEAVQRPTMKFVATKTAEQLDLQALHRVRERLVGQRTGIINQIRAFLLESGIAVRQGLHFLRAELPGILAKRTDVLSPRMLRVIEDLAGDWRRLDERIEREKAPRAQKNSRNHPPTRGQAVPITVRHRRNAGPPKTRSICHAPTYVWNKHKFLESPEIVVSSRPCHRPRMSFLRGLVPQ
jgi:hypothetical protein